MGSWATPAEAAVQPTKQDRRDLRHADVRHGRTRSLGGVCYLPAPLPDANLSLAMLVDARLERTDWTSCQANREDPTDVRVRVLHRRSEHPSVWTDEWPGAGRSLSVSWRRGVVYTLDRDSDATTGTLFRSVVSLDGPLMVAFSVTSMREGPRRWSNVFVVVDAATAREPR